MSAACSFERVRELDADTPTLVEGLPGMGLVASIVVDHLRRELELDQLGHLRSEAFPNVASFEDGLVEESVRVYGGTDPDVMTLHSHLPIPDDAARPLSECVLTGLADAFEEAIFLVGAPAQAEQDMGEVTGIATTEAQRDRLEDSGIELAGETGAIGGATGALLRACYRSDLPAVALLVRCRPKTPDPGAARSVIEHGLERLVDFEIDTEQLEQRDKEIQEQMQQVAHQFQQAGPTPGPSTRGEAPESIYS